MRPEATSSTITCAYDKPQLLSIYVCVCICTCACMCVCADFRSTFTTAGSSFTTAVSSFTTAVSSFTTAARLESASHYLRRKRLCRRHADFRARMQIDAACIRQHTSAYVSIRQQTPRQFPGPHADRCRLQLLRVRICTFVLVKQPLLY